MARLLQSSPYSGTFDAALTEYLDKNLGKLIIGMFPALDWLEKEGRVKRPKNLSGSQVKFAVELNVGSGAGPRGENDYLPDADQTDMVNGTVSWQKGIKGRIQLSSEALAFGRGSPQNFADVVKQEARNLLLAMKLQAVPIIWGDGTGKLAHINGAVAASSSVTVDAVEKYGECSPGVRWLHDGMKVISVNGASSYGADASMSAAVEVASLDSYTGLTMASAISATDNYHLVEHHCSDTSDATEKTKGSVTIGTANSYRGGYGFTAMVDDGTLTSSYCGISESSYPQWVGTLNHNSGTARSLSMSLFYGLFGKLTRKASTFKPSLVCWMNWDLYQTLAELLESSVEFRPRELDGGFKEMDLMVNGVQIPIRLDHGAPGYIYMLNPEKITFLEPKPPHVVKAGAGPDGWRDVADKTNVEKKYEWWFNLYTTSRSHQGAIMDISHTVTSF